jgi:thimet oligopeptidase
MKQKEIALAGAAAAAIAIATKLLLSSLKSSSSSRDGGREEGIHIRVKQSASEILKQADRMIALSQSVHDAVAAVPLDEVSLCLSHLSSFQEQFRAFLWGFFYRNHRG